MPTLDRDSTALLVIDIQGRLMPSIHGAAAVVANGRRLLDAAGLLGIPALFTEQNAAGLGGTDAALEPGVLGPVFHKRSFDGCRDGLLAALPPRPELVVAGCEAHVCVLQTVLGLLDAGRRVWVVADAVGSRVPANRDAALRRMERHGAEPVTTEMVIFEWLRDCDHPRFKAALALVR